jgi:predicted ATPase
MDTTVIGREQEIAALTQFIEAVGELPGALLIEGEAGIGKTTIWEAGLRLARERGYLVMASRAGESEARLSFTALGDFFESVPDEVLLDLPEPQRTAIQVALLRVESPDNPPERRAVSLAALAVIRALLAGGPLVIAVDDLQWLDPSSARILAFVARRLLSEPIGILAAVRLGEHKRDPLTLDNAMSWRRAVHLRVGPMGADQLGRLFRHRLGVDLRYPVVGASTR